MAEAGLDGEGQGARPVMCFEIRYVDDIEPRYFWHLVTAQGRILAWSENYSTKADCIDAITAIRTADPAADVLDRTGEAADTPDRGPS